MANGRKICQHVPLQGLPKCTQIGIFGMQKYNQATLQWGAYIDTYLPRRWNEVQFTIPLKIMHFVVSGNVGAYVHYIKTKLLKQPIGFTC
jgi:hypothetical protein